MSNFKKIFSITVLIILFSFNICFAINENALSTYTTNEITTNTVDSSETLNNEDTASTIVSSVSSLSDNSTITNILSIALIVVGVLLILLAIAILIRLH